MDDFPPRSEASETTLGGLAADEVRSALQKSIRRGLLEQAVLAAYELFSSGPEMEDGLWRRLEIIAAEDIGLGDPGLPAVIEALHAQRLRATMTNERWIFCAHAVRLLVTARKDRTSVELANWARESVTRGERQVEIEDFHIDRHTARGKAMGRGVEHFYEAGGPRLENEIESRETRWGDYLRQLHRRSPQ